MSALDGKNGAAYKIVANGVTRYQLSVVMHYFCMMFPGARVSIVDHDAFRLDRGLCTHTNWSEERLNSEYVLGWLRGPKEVPFVAFVKADPAGPSLYRVFCDYTVGRHTVEVLERAGVLGLRGVGLFSHTGDCPAYATSVLQVHYIPSSTCTEAALLVAISRALSFTALDI